MGIEMEKGDGEGEGEKIQGRGEEISEMVVMGRLVGWLAGEQFRRID